MNLLDRIGLRLADPSRLRVYPVMLAVVPLLVWGVSLATGHGIVDGAGNVVGADFAAFYTAGAFVRDGRTADLASLAAQSDFQHALVAPVAVSGFTPWINPPFFAYAFAPLAALSYPIALGVYGALGLATFVVTVLFAQRLLRLPLSRGRLFLLAASYFPTVAWFTFGQTTAFSLAVLAASVAAFLVERDLLGGLLLGCLAYKPQLAIGLAVALVFARRWRAAVGGALSVAIWFALSFLVTPDATRTWLTSSPSLFAFIRQSAYPMQGLASLYGGSALLLDGVSRSLAGVVGAALTLLAFGGLFRLWQRVPWHPDHASFRLALASTLAVGLLVSPHLYFYDLMLMLLPVALAFSVLRANEATTSNATIVAATAWVYFLGLPSPYLALGELTLTRRLIGHPCALQLETVAVALWAWRVGRRALAEAKVQPSTP